MDELRKHTFVMILKSDQFSINFAEQKISGVSLLNNHFGIFVSQQVVFRKGSPLLGVHRRGHVEGNDERAGGLRVHGRRVLPIEHSERQEFRRDKEGVPITA